MYQNIYYIRKENKIVLFDDEHGIRDFDYEPYAYKRDPYGEYKSIYGDSLSKIYGDDARYQENVFESDVNPMTRTLIDVYEDDDSVSTNHVIFNFDIEVGMEGGYAPADDPWQPITSIAFKDSVTEDRQVVILDEGGLVSNSEYDDELGKVIIRSFRDEKTLLQYFLQKYIEIRPTILTGWNIDNFDIPYLYNRLKKILGHKYAKQLSPIGIAFVGSKRLDNTVETTIAGVSSLDYLKIYRQFTYTERPNYRLGTIGLIEVGMDKMEYDGNLNDLFKTDIKKFVQYNLTDIDIVDALDKKLKLIELVMAICHICHVPYEFIHYSSKFLEGALLIYLRREQLVAPNKQKKPNKNSPIDDDEEDGFAGAFVKEPIRGKYDWVFSNDINSLYPSAIRSLNISPETKVGKITNWEDVKNPNVGHNNKLVLEGSEMNFLNSNGNTTLTSDSLYEMMGKYNLSISSAGIIYSQNDRGLLPSILDKWYAERKEFQRLKFDAGQRGDNVEETFYNRRQHVQKILLNSLYGVLGLPVFRFYDLDNALSVTATGQDIIKSTAYKANETYREILLKSGKETTPEDDFVVYIDTDSVYMSNKPLISSLGLSDDETCKNLTIKVSDNIVDTINKYYDDLMMDAFHCKNHVIKTAGETIGKTAIWIVKKRYAIHKVYDLEKCEDVDNFHIKGLDVVRSSFPEKFRKFMLDMDKKEGIIADFLFGVDKSIVDEKILSFKRGVGTFPVEQVARNTSVKNVSKFSEKIKDRVLGEYPRVEDDKKPGKTLTYPAHVKAAINFNKLIKLKNLDKVTEPIFNGEKIKYVYLKQNEYGIDTIGFRGYHDPQFVMDFINKYYDGMSLYNRELKKKIDDFYDALKWAPATESDKIVNEFFKTDSNVPYHKYEKKKREKKVETPAESSADFFSF